MDNMIAKLTAAKQTDELPDGEEDLENILDEAQELLETYEDGLQIEVSIISAYLAHESGAWWGGLTRAWYPLYGIRVQRSYRTASALPDAESFSLEAIAGVQEPDVNYVTLIDWYRRPFMFWNRWLGWVWKFDVPDLWGTSILKAGAGRETLTLEHMNHPVRAFKYIQACSKTMLKAFKAVEKLKKMQTERKAAPSMEQKVDAAARFQLAVEKRLAELRGNP